MTTQIKKETSFAVGVKLIDCIKQLSPSDLHQFKIGLEKAFLEDTDKGEVFEPVQFLEVYLGWGNNKEGSAPSKLTPIQEAGYLYYNKLKSYRPRTQKAA